MESVPFAKGGNLRVFLIIPHQKYYRNYNRQWGEKTGKNNSPSAEWRKTMEIDFACFQMSLLWSLEL